MLGTVGIFGQNCYSYQKIAEEIALVFEMAAEKVALFDSDWNSFYAF